MGNILFPAFPEWLHSMLHGRPDSGSGYSRIWGGTWALLAWVMLMIGFYVAPVEWLHRLMTEARRLRRRYLLTNTLFVIGAARQLSKA